MRLALRLLRASIRLNIHGARQRVDFNVLEIFSQSAYSKPGLAIITGYSKFSIVIKDRNESQ